jgi:hypothetical protein
VTEWRFGWLDLLVLRLQSLLITLNHNTIAILHTLQSLHTNPLTLFPLVFTTRFLARIYNTWTIKVSPKYTLPISLHYGTLKVFTSHVKSSEADFFFNYELPAAISYRHLPRTRNSSVHNSQRTCSFLVLVLSTASCLLNYCLLASEFTSYEPSAQTPQKTRLRYCCVTWPLGCLSASYNILYWDVASIVARAYRGLFIEPLHNNDHVLLARD